MKDLQRHSQRLIISWIYCLFFAIISLTYISNLILTPTGLPSCYFNLPPLLLSVFHFKNNKHDLTFSRKIISYSWELCSTSIMFCSLHSYGYTLWQCAAQWFGLICLMPLEKTVFFKCLQVYILSRKGRRVLWFIFENNTCLFSLFIVWDSTHFLTLNLLLHPISPHPLLSISPFPLHFFPPISLLTLPCPTVLLPLSPSHFLSPPRPPSPSPSRSPFISLSSCSL